MRPLYLKDDRGKEYLQYIYIYLHFIFIDKSFSSINSFMNYVFIGLTCVTYVEGVSNE